MLCIPLEVKLLLATILGLVTSLEYPSTLRVEETRSSEMFGNFQWPTPCHIPGEELSKTKHDYSFILRVQAS